MSTKLVIRLSAIVPCLLSLLLLRPYLKGELREPELLGFSVFLFMLWGLGVFIGIVISVIARKPAIDPYFYLAGQLIIVAAIAAFWIVAMYEGGQRQKNFGNIEDNESYIKWMVDDERREVVRMAYLKLTEKFPENSFILAGHKINFRDTTVENIKQSIYTIHLAYYKTHDSILYKSETAVLKGE